MRDALWSFGPTTLSSAINYAYLQERWKQQEFNEKDKVEGRNNLPKQETAPYENVIAEEKHERIEEESSEILDLTVAVAVAETKELNSLKVEEDDSNWKSTKHDSVATDVIQIDETVAEEEKRGYGEKKLIAQSSMLARCLTRNFATIQALHKNAPPFLSIRTSHTTSPISSPFAARTSNLGASISSSALDPRFSALFYPFAMTKKGQCGNRMYSDFVEVPCDAYNADPIGTLFGDDDYGFHVYRSLGGGTRSDTGMLVIPKEREEYSNSMMLTSSVFSYFLLSLILVVKGRGCVGGPRRIPLHLLEWGAPVINQRGSGHKVESETMIGGGSCERLNEINVSFTLGSGRANGEDGSGENFQWAENGCGDDARVWVDRISTWDTHAGFMDLGLATANLSRVCSEYFPRDSRQMPSISVWMTNGNGNGPCHHNLIIQGSFEQDGYVNYWPFIQQARYAFSTGFKEVGPPWYIMLGWWGDKAVQPHIYTYRMDLNGGWKWAIGLKEYCSWLGF